MTKRAACWLNSAGEKQQTYCRNREKLNQDRTVVIAREQGVLCKQPCGKRESRSRVAAETALQFFCAAGRVVAPGHRTRYRAPGNIAKSLDGWLAPSVLIQRGRLGLHASRDTRIPSHAPSLQSIYEQRLRPHGGGTPSPVRRPRADQC